MVRGADVGCCRRAAGTGGCKLCNGGNIAASSPCRVWCVPLLWRSAGAVARWRTRWFNILKPTTLRQKSPHNLAKPTMRTLLPVANELHARLEASVQTHASTRRPARVTRRSLRGAPAGGRRCALCAHGHAFAPQPSWSRDAPQLTAGRDRWQSRACSGGA